MQVLAALLAPDVGMERVVAVEGREHESDFALQRRKDGVPQLHGMPSENGGKSMLDTINPISWTRGSLYAPDS
jgi:hypothetical protein